MALCTLGRSEIPCTNSWGKFAWLVNWSQSKRDEQPHVSRLCVERAERRRPVAAALRHRVRVPGGPWGWCEARAGCVPFRLCGGFKGKRFPKNKHAAEHLSDLATGVSKNPKKCQVNLFGFLVKPSSKRAAALEPRDHRFVAQPLLDNKAACEAHASGASCLGVFLGKNGFGGWVKGNQQEKLWFHPNVETKPLGVGMVVNLLEF